MRVFNLYAVRAPLHRKADLGGFARLEAEGLFVEVQKLLVVVITPAVVVRVVPVVIAAFTHQTHLEVVGRQFVALAVSNQQLELNRAVAIGFSTVKQATQPRQTVCRPYRLHQATGNRAPARLLQTGLNNQLQRRFGIAPLAVDAEGLLAIGVEHAFVQLQILGQLRFCHRTELIARQGTDRLAQWPHIDLPAQAVTGCRSTVQVTPRNLDFSGLPGAQRGIAALEFKCHALG